MMIHPLCRIDEIPDQGTKLVEFFGRQVHVYKVNGKPRAAMNTCMHFGGPLECQGNKFVCAWHGAEFAMDDGQRLTAPAPSNAKLMFLSTRVDDDVLNYIWDE